ncbi:hypothetical protein GCM10028793_26080 [Nocardiopsis oceani]
MTRAAETATIKRQEKGENHPHQQQTPTHADLGATDVKPRARSNNIPEFPVLLPRSLHNGSR